MKILTLFLGTLLITCSISAAPRQYISFGNGIDLYKNGQAYHRVIENRQKQNDVYNSLEFQHYVIGSAEALSFSGNICLPMKINATQLYDIVYNFLNSHPEKRSQPGVVLIFESISKAFPCLDMSKLKLPDE